MRRVAELDRLLEQAHEDIRKETEISAELENAKGALEREVRDLKDKLADAESGKAAGPQRTIMRLEAKIEETESRIRTESAARAEAVKEKRAAERAAAEIRAKADEISREKAAADEAVARLERRIKELRNAVASGELREAEARVSNSKAERQAHSFKDRADTLARENERLNARLEAEKKNVKELESKLSAMTGAVQAVASA